MSEKRTEEILNAVLKKVSKVVYDVYVDKDCSDNITPDSVYDTIKNIPESLHCPFVFTKGKKKDKVCNVVLCPHHINP